MNQESASRLSVIDVPCEGSITHLKEFGFIKLYMKFKLEYIKQAKYRQKIDERTGKMRL